MAPTRTSQPAAILQDVSVTYGSHPALSHLTVTFPRGATGLLGANGAGKTSVIRAMLGLITLDQGRVDVLGVNVAEDSQGVRARVGYVPEADTAIPGLTAIASVAYCGELAGVPRRDALLRAHDVLSYVGLDEARYRHARTFSTGMRQRLKLAQVLVHDPDLLVLDEPTNGLDPRGRDQMLALIAELGHAHGLSVIVSSHLLPDIECTCDAIVALNHGELATAGPLTEWHRPDGGRYELRVKGDRLAFVAALSSAGIACETGEGDVITAAIQDGNTQPVFAAAQRLGVQVRQLQAHSQTLEAAFVRAVAADDRG